MANDFFNDPQLQTVSINDFTAGIVRFARGDYPVVYPSVAPLGSASVAYRCYAKAGIGLIPFPTYTQVQTFTDTGTSSTPFLLSIAGMESLAANFDDSLITYFEEVEGTTASPPVTVDSVITRLAIPTRSGIVSATPTTVYTNTFTTPALTNWPNMDIGEFENGGTFARCVVTTDFNTGGGGPVPQWVSIPDWASSADENSGALSGPAFESPRAFYHATRLGYFESPFATTAGGFTSCNGDILTVSSTPLVLQPFTQSGIFFGELGSVIGTWGSISTGEFFALYTQGGALLFYGDLLAPTQVIKLPGVVGTGNVLGKAAQSTLGLIYATEDDGVYAWNGGNTADKISLQIPDDVLARTKPPSTFGLVDHTHSSQAAWGQWVFFPNNWVFDMATQSWWNMEDPATLNFQVHTQSVSSQFFHSAPGFVSNNTGAALTLHTYRWDKNLPATSYTWISNPIPATVGALVQLQAVEVVATNPTANSATITVTATVPPGQTPFPQQNPTQAQTYTIPANTVAWRGSLTFGYTDYNIELQVQAANSGSAAAPTIHALNIGYTMTRVSKVR